MEFIYRFDQPLDRVVFSREVELGGWLFHPTGKPIHGLRALVRRRFGREQIFRARRKRNRPDVAAAYPEIAGAAASGFLLELKLNGGRNQLTFQVLDHERRWQTFATGSITARPLAFLTRLGLTNTRPFVVDYLQRRLGANARAGAGHASIASARAEVSPSEFKRVDLFATSKSNLFIIEIGELVAAGFRELGCEAQLHLDQVPAENPPRDTLQIVVTPHEFYNLFLTQTLSRSRAQELTRHVHLLCTEQPETGWFEGNLRWGHYSLGMADINPLGVAAYRRRGLKAQQLQLGYHEVLAHAPPVPYVERQHALTFLGSITDRREEFFARYADFFSQHDCQIRLVPLGFAKTKATRSYLSVAGRNELLSQSRILLNLHYSEQKYFEWHRMLTGLANGCCIVSETCQGYGPLLPNEHFVMVEPEHLMTACRYYLAHPKEAETIASAGQRFVETKLRQAQTCADYLGAIQRGERDWAALDLPLDQAPRALPTELHREISRQKRQAFFEALRLDLRRQPAAIAKKEERVLLSATVTQEQRDAIAPKREGYRERFARQKGAQERGAPVFEIRDNAAFADSITPALSVVITLYNYSHHIEECVASITASTARLSWPLEIVIVNDASTDDSLARAFACQAASQLPVRVVDKKINTGLADARNVGTQIARADYIFMMDADNLVYPEALPQLFAAATRGRHDAAYSLLCRFRETSGNRVGLLSYFDWDPQILAQYPYIDAMAIFRRATLLELGGYDNELNQIGWFGWEDYEMWLRFAQRGRSVAFVPNTLCLYRHHDTSMIKSTNLFESELVDHLLERYGDWLRQFEARATVFGVAREKICRKLNGSRNGMNSPNDQFRSLAYTGSPEQRFWWHQLPRSDYVPPLYAALTDDEWEVMRGWFADTTSKNYVGECGVPIMSLLQGMILGSGFRRIVQLGTYAGYSALLLGFFLRQMEGTRGLITFEIHEFLGLYTRDWLERAGLGSYVRVELLSSLDAAAPEAARNYLQGAPELIFIDSSHEYAATLSELNLWYAELAPGGLIVLHDTSDFAVGFDPTKQGGVRRALREWRQTHPDAECFSLNRNVPAMRTPEMLYQDFCGAGLIQKPL